MLAKNENKLLTMKNRLVTRFTWSNFQFIDSNASQKSSSASVASASENVITLNFTIVKIAPTKREYAECAEQKSLKWEDIDRVWSDYVVNMET
jgi:hypothetical protein